MKKNLKRSLIDSWKKIKNNPSFTLKEQLGYASGSFGNSMGQDMIGTFFMLYMTDFMGIKASMLLIITIVAKIINIIGDPVAGALFDLPSRNGKSRVKPFLLLSPFPLAITSILLFIVPSPNMTVRLVWVFAFYFIYCLSDTFYDMSLMTTSARMTNNPEDRKNFYTVGSFAGALGTTLPGGVIPIFIDLADTKTTEGYIYLAGAVVFGIIGLLTMVVPAFTLKEKIFVEVREAPVKMNARAIVQNRPLLVSVASQILDSIRQICYGGLIYFYQHTLGMASLSTIIGIISVTLSYIGIALIPIVGKKLSARDIIAGGYFYTAFFYILLLIFGYDSIVFVAFCIGLAGFPNGATGAARKILLADSADYMEWKTRKKYGVPVRSEGMVFAINSMASRINGLWKDLLLPAGLILVGYQEAQTVDDKVVQVQQTPETLRGLFYLIVIPGIVGNLLPGLVMLLDNFHGKKRETILAELMEMRKSDENSSQGELCLETVGASDDGFIDSEPTGTRNQIENISMENEPCLEEIDSTDNSDCTDIISSDLSCQDDTSFSNGVKDHIDE